MSLTKNNRMLLNEWCQKNGIVFPDYETTSEGLDHCKRFITTCDFQDYTYRSRPFSKIKDSIENVAETIIDDLVKKSYETPVNTSRQSFDTDDRVYVNDTFTQYTVVDVEVPVTQTDVTHKTVVMYTDIELVHVISDKLRTDLITEIVYYSDKNMYNFNLKYTGKDILISSSRPVNQDIKDDIQKFSRYGLKELTYKNVKIEQMIIDIVDFARDTNNSYKLLYVKSNSETIKNIVDLIDSENISMYI